MLEAICAFVATVRHTVVQDEGSTAVLYSFLRLSSKILSPSLSLSVIAVSPPLLEHKTALLDILLAAFTDVESNVRNIAVMTISEMIQVKGILDQSEVSCCWSLNQRGLYINFILSHTHSY